MLADLLGAGNVTVLSGAGLSTESGIPDYRGPSGQARRTGQPMTYQSFTGAAVARQRYWARSHLGWRHVTGASPNAGHRAVAALERAGLLRGVITQNVDGLHQAGGAVAVTELHGSLHRVVCLSCWTRSPREELDARLRAANPRWTEAAVGLEPAVNPDGDVALEDTVGFTVVGLPGLRRRAQAGRGVLRRERAQRPGGRVLRAGDVGVGAAGARVIADGHVRPPLRAARGVARDPGGHRQPGGHPGRRAGDRGARRAARRHADRAHRAARACRPEPRASSAGRAGYRVDGAKGHARSSRWRQRPGLGARWARASRGGVPGRTGCGPGGYRGCGSGVLFSG